MKRTLLMMFVIFALCGCTAQSGTAQTSVSALPNEKMDPLFVAAAFATEEAIINALVAAETMTGRAGLTVAAMPHPKVTEIMRQYNRLAD